MTEHFKLNVIVSILLLVVLSIINIYLLPKDKYYEQQINMKDQQIAQMYDSATNTYTDMGAVEKLQQDVYTLKYDTYSLKFVNLVTFYLFLLTLISWGAWYLQHIYTHIHFTSGEGYDRILAFSLLIAGVLVIILYYVNFAT